jgi:glycosyltransferase involved in cell wall biosynthesis
LNRGSATRIRICHLTSVHPVFDNRIFHKECRSLNDKGFEVHLVARNPTDEVRDGIFIHALPMVVSGRLERMTGFIRKLFRIARGIDARIYHFHDPELIPVGLLLKAMGKRVIYDTHEDVTSAIRTKPWIHPMLRGAVACAFHIFERAAVRCFDAVISGHPTASLNIPLAVPIYNYPDLDHFPDAGGTREQNGRFLWLGLFNEARGAAKIREAISRYPELAIDVIGPIEDITWKQERMNFIGTFPVEEAFRRARGYVAGLVTYLPEPNNVNSSPNKMFEYMALGIPVIASDFSGWKRIIETAGCGICLDPRKPEAIAAAMHAMLRDGEMVSAMGRKGRQLILTRYNWTVESQKLFDVYNNIIGKMQDG